MCLTLTSDFYVPPVDEPGLRRLDPALDHAVAALAVETKVRDGVAVSADAALDDCRGPSDSRGNRDH